MGVTDFCQLPDPAGYKTGTLWICRKCHAEWVLLITPVTNVKYWRKRKPGAKHKRH